MALTVLEATRPEMSVIKPPQIIVVGGQKGGTGKTTTALQLLLMGAKAGLRVLGVDGDRANAMSEVLANRNDNDRLQPKITSVQKLVSQGVDQFKGAKAFARDILHLATDYDLVVVDTAGFDADDKKNLELRGALLVADLFLVVTRPGYLDTRVLRSVWTMIEGARYSRQAAVGENETPDPLEVLCVLNAVPSNSLQTDVRAAIEDLNANVPELPIAEVKVVNRAIYSRGIKSGTLAMDQRPNPKERTELMRLYEAVLNRTYTRVIDDGADGVTRRAEGQGAQ